MGLSMLHVTSATLQRYVCSTSPLSAFRICSCRQGYSSHLGKRQQILTTRRGFMLDLTKISHKRPNFTHYFIPVGLLRYDCCHLCSHSPFTRRLRRSEVVCDQSFPLLVSFYEGQRRLLDPCTTPEIRQCRAIRPVRYQLCDGRGVERNPQR